MDTKLVMLTLLKLVPFAITFILYFALWLPEPSAEATVVKVLPAMCLVLFLCLYGKVFCSGRRYDRLMVVGTFLCAVADGLLAWDRVNNAFFLAGMGVFGLAHCVFMAAFRCTPLRLLLTIPWLTAAIILYGVLVPGLSGVMYFFVAVYALLIAGMGWRAFARVPIRCCIGQCTDRRCAKCVDIGDEENHDPNGRCYEASRVRWTHGMAAAGAVMFVISDTILAVFAFRIRKDLFIRRIKVLSTYWAALLFLALSVDPPETPCPCQDQERMAHLPEEDEDASRERFSLEATA